MLLSTSYLSCITKTSSKQTPQRALESKETSNTTTHRTQCTRYNVLYHRAGHITEPVKICQDQHNSALYSMSQQHHDLLLHYKGRLQLAL
ncbi:uncharacterized protein M421DRAFT_175798 [Didymella exigua CBS 183.55]|uniref:Uncharacterized protein n=1 Tax=Didymella exigua CBS 183.55 TaxID=1150837 RepID=A0A6A5RKK7_9PLEO|nr:uncharacterized protein M421DRAFT_175798 [Didymella exigua CBS 183.55]KAF1927810.1 hypothetical protein M421DRAFT_175798 [Didymella exigua CBS 183.55]